MAATKMAVGVGTDVNDALMLKLKQEEDMGLRREKVGFL